MPRKRNPLPPGDRPNCAHCGKPMPAFRYWNSGFFDEKQRHWGHDGNNYFCTLRCGFLHGLYYARRKEHRP